MSRRWQPALWASKKPFGIGENRPNNYAEIWSALKENRDELGYAWRILKHGVCDGCALGTAGMRDWTLDEVHLCNVRLRLLRLNTMPALDPDQLFDVRTLESKTSAQLRDLGRLPYPMVRRAGELGFSRVTWRDAIDLIASRIGSSAPDRLGFYLTSRGMTNENYYVVQKCVRAMGTNSIDNAARVCHSPSTFGLKQSLGVPATTCSYTDLIGTDLVVFIGSNVANNQPVMMKYLFHAKKEGTKVAVVNNYREPGMDKYWVPSNVESALFGTQIADRFFLVNVGGDIAFLSGTLKHMIANRWVDRSFIEKHTTGFDAVAVEVDRLTWPDLEARAGASRDEMFAFAQMLAAARSAVLVWSMGVTQHTFGEDNVRAIINLGLSKGFVGRAKCGLMPIRGHSGVQGGAEMGAYTGVLPGAVVLDETSAAAMSERWGFRVDPAPGYTAPQMIDAASEGRLDVLFSVGGNFLEVMPDPRAVEQAMARVPLRVHMDIVTSTQMLIDPCETVVLLPAATRYETPGGLTETSTERRIIFNPEIPGRRIGEARPEWAVFSELAANVTPENASAVTWSGTPAIREEIARIVPLYDGIQHLREEGDQVQYGGPMLCDGWRFPTADGKAHFSVVPVPLRDAPHGSYVVATRRGKQFNSMVQKPRDPLTGLGRDAVLMNRADADAEGLVEGDAVELVNQHGRLRGRIALAAIAPGNLQVHWPEAQVLIDRQRRSPEAGIPDYNAVVRIERAVAVAEPNR
ncbi:MAG TPA: FdhF/YdeP family oxidoreductase [Actinomycetota bacterium]|nr:FdhF/YdeP family oxidoreductase [Actinomycetota bacterium]